MAINFDDVANRVWQILRGRGYKLKFYEEDGSPALDYKNARKFFVEDLGIMVSINQLGEDDNEIRVSYGNNIDYDDISVLLKNLRNSAKFFGILFNAEHFEKSLQPRDFAFLATRVNQEDVAESYDPETTLPDSAESAIWLLRSNGHNTRDARAIPDPNVDRVWLVLCPVAGQAFVVYLDWNDFEEVDFYLAKSKHFSVSEAKDVSKLKGTTRTSRQNIGQPTKVLFRHSKPVDEDKFAARTRNIEKIFIETYEGERLKFPVNYIQGARAIARHISEGGVWDDQISNYIKESCVELMKLKEFKRKVTPINEEVEQICSTVKNRVFRIVKEMKRIQGPKTYHQFVESFKPRQIDEDIIEPEVNRLITTYPTLENFDVSVIECVAKLTAKKKPAKPEQEVVINNSVNNPLEEFVNWTKEYVKEVDDESDEEDLVNDLDDDINLKRKLKKDPKKLNKYIKK